MTIERAAGSGIQRNCAGRKGGLVVGEGLPGDRAAGERVEADPNAAVGAPSVNGVTRDVAGISGERRDAPGNITVKLGGCGRLRTQRRPSIELRENRIVARIIGGKAGLQECSVRLNHFAILRESVQQKLIGYVAVRHGSLAEEPIGALADERGGLRRGRFTFVRGELLRQKRNKRDDENDTAKQ